MIVPKQTKWRKGILTKYKCEMKLLQKHQILVDSLAGQGFGERIDVH
jgi:hypothetical protein